MYETKNGVRVWGRDIEDNTIRQAEMTNRLPILAGPVALMPDAHVGKGSTVGSVVPTKGAVIPSCIGVDIGCGMAAIRLGGLTASRLPNDLNTLMPVVAKAIPAGVGVGRDSLTDIEKRIGLPTREELTRREMDKACEQAGSLGSGNHFFEIGIDENEDVWVVLHSGSRGVGNMAANRHINTAKSWYQENIAGQLESKDLAYFLDSSEEFQTYVDTMLWAQDYARLNREIMLAEALKGITKWFGDRKLKVSKAEEINCHHNFTQQEVHGGNKIWVTRKGAIKADVGDLGIIPGSMGTSTYIVRGLGNPLSYNSCSHGAGRLMGRKEAKEKLTGSSLKKVMEGKIWNEASVKELVDEHPEAYKDIHRVMEDQSDLVEVVHVLDQVLNYKGQ